jgi:hypothetical protein
MNAQQEFLVGELWMLAWAASVQRAKLYRRGYSSVAPASKNGQRLSDHLFEYLLREVIPEYTGGVEEEQHYIHIDNLIARANGAGTEVLGELGYTARTSSRDALLARLILKYSCIGKLSFLVFEIAAF